MSKLTHRLTLLTLAVVTQFALGATNEHITYYHNNAVGSPLAASDESGAELWHESYDPFGSRQLEQPAGQGNDLWFAGKPQDSSGLSYFGARFYDPTIGRFISRDPVEFRQDNTMSFNRYVYANNNPYRFVDPNGELPILLAIPLIIKAADLAITAYDVHQAYQEDGVEGALKETAVSAGLSVVAGAKVVNKVSKFFKRPPCGCFEAGTLIDTPDGLLPIEEIQQGDLVLSKSEITGDYGYQTVVQKHVLEDRPLYDLVLEGDDGERFTVTSTDNHPFFVENFGWRLSAELQPGDVLDAKQGSVVVVGVTARGEGATTYNFTVAEYETFLVSDAGLWVHNCPEDAAKGGDKFTKEVVKRGKPGRDGGQSQHVIEKVNGQTTSTTHQVVKDGKLIHQHQDHVGKHGTVRRFSDELTGTKTIDDRTTKDTMTGGRLGFPPGS